MPITLEKILSPTAVTSFEFLGETVTVTFAPMRYTGEMQDFAQRIDEEEGAERQAIADLREEALRVVAAADKDKASRDVAKATAAEIVGRAEERARALDLRERKALRDYLASDGDGNGGPPGMLVAWDVMEGRKPIPVTRKQLDRLPDLFLRFVFVSLAQENLPDPPKAPTSDES